MRESNFANGTIHYPDEICFAFNRNLITVYAETEFIEFFTTNYNGTSDYVDKRYTYNNKTIIDISEYLRVAFNNSEDLIVSKKIIFGVKSDSGDTFVMNFIVVWGALAIGDTFNGNRSITYFKYFPQTVSMFLDSTDSVSSFDDSDGINQTDISCDNGLIHVNLDGIFLSSVKEYGEIWIDRQNAEVSKNVFTYQFDETFFIKNGRTTIKVYVDDSTCGLFLRWIDRHGFYQYYLFTEGDNLYKTTDVGDSLRIHTSILPEELRPYYGIVRSQGKTIKKTVKACALGLSKEMFDLVIGVVSSPIVHLYLSGKWIPVKIVSGTYTRTYEELQDFEIQIELPEIDLQRL